jgi:2-polyprenyl-3-methyl-5-hydroxy-6-metoxy-1,4-benzoquinol methylase
MTEKQSCGCTYARSEYGARYRVSRCKAHRQQTPIQNVFDEAKYASMGVLLESPPHVEQFVRNIGNLPQVAAGSLVEFGAGVSPYVRMVQQAGYTYTAVDATEWACEYMRNKFDVPVHCGTIDAFIPETEYDVVLAAHVLEHVIDAPAAMQKFNSVLRPGGMLYLIIPDDRDMHNQDHNWFFTIGSLYTMLGAFGFVPVSCAVDSTVVPHEDFIYCVARKHV